MIIHLKNDALSRGIFNSNMHGNNNQNNNSSLMETQINNNYNQLLSSINTNNALIHELISQNYNDLMNIINQQQISNNNTNPFHSNSFNPFQ